MTITRLLLTDLDDAVRLRLAEEAAALRLRISDEEEARKYAAKAAKERIEDLTGQAVELETAVRMRKAYRQIECEITSGMVVRLDTGEQIGFPTDAERQRSLFEGVESVTLVTENGPETLTPAAGKRAKRGAAESAA
jgi:hypothetical protein